MTAKETLDEIAAQVTVCENCALHFSRKRSVPGEGPADAEIMFIGEGPGFYENEEGRPFIGQAGKFLDELLGVAGLNREKVFICNVVKCRPPGNRDPLPEELSACNLYLDRQIAAIDPCVIVTLGRFSMAKFLPFAKISSIHGHAVIVNEKLIVPMFHPAAALHQPSLKPQIIEDFKLLPKALEQMKRNTRSLPVVEEPKEDPGLPAQEEPPAEQLSLF
ncbi:MAG: uracil-DNA glycosylase family protein [Anaerolineaceae bacterium]